MDNLIEKYIYIGHDNEPEAEDLHYIHDILFKALNVLDDCYDVSKTLKTKDGRKVKIILQKAHSDIASLITYLAKNKY